MANALQAVLNRAARDEGPAAETVAVVKVAKPANNPKKKVEPLGPLSDMPAATTTAQAAAPTMQKFHRPSRDNRRFIGGHFEPAVGKQLKMIAVEDDTTVQALLEEALDLLFVKKGRQKVADLSK